MKLVDMANPVRASWLADQGSRLDPGPYVSDTYAARMFLKRIPTTDRLADVTERMFHAGRVTRSWTHSREHGVPFLGSADIFEADLSYLPRITRSSADSNPKLPLEPGWTLITRSGMTAGRVTYARHEMKGSACSEDVLRVVANELIPAGYLYTFLASPYGIAMIKGRIYGTSVKHIEPPHLADIPVPRLGAELEQRIHDLIWKAMDLRSQFQAAEANCPRPLRKGRLGRGPREPTRAQGQAPGHAHTWELFGQRPSECDLASPCSLIHGEYSDSDTDVLPGFRSRVQLGPVLHGVAVQGSRPDSQHGPRRTDSPIHKH